jgi:microcystin-dependent protein
MEGTLATIMIFAGNFAPRAWMYCDGSILAISQNDALFSLIGTTYGGDGISTFALPDLRGRIPVGTGNGAGLAPIVLGQRAGSESVTLTQANLPAHSHTMSASVGTSSSNADGSKNPSHTLATTPTPLYAPANAGTGTSLAGANVTLGAAGSSLPIPIVQSYQAINYVICVEGIYPSRS